MAFWAVFLIATLLSVATTAITYILTPSAPKQANATASAFSDFSFPQATDGTPQSVVFGDAWIEDWTVLWVGDYATQTVKSSQLSSTGPGWNANQYQYGGGFGSIATATTLPAYTEVDATA